MKVCLTGLSQIPAVILHDAKLIACIFPIACDQDRRVIDAR
jgi:hypothetical protein